MFTLIALLLDNAGICGSVTSHKAALLAESVAAHRQEAARLAQEAERLAQEGERLAAIAQRLAEQKAERLANIGKGLGEMEEAAALAKLREPLDLAGRVKVCEGLREVVHCETKAKIRAGEGSTAANEAEERLQGATDYMLELREDYSYYSDWEQGGLHEEIHDLFTASYYGCLVQAIEEPNIREL